MIPLRKLYPAEQEPPLRFPWATLVVFLLAAALVVFGGYEPARDAVWNVLDAIGARQ